jgi:glycosyltransferase involved in cell wall biosynthesis
MFSHWQWRILSLPPRHFSWRVRGNALFWSMSEREALEQPYDLLVATSMVDLATLRGLVPALSRIPAIVYFHENQFEYPQDKQKHSLLEAQITSIYSALAADRILFNSGHNRDSFLAGCTALLEKLPDRVPPGVVSILQEKASVLPVPFDHQDFASVEPFWPGVPVQNGLRPLRLLWVGRFEHDKGPEGLLRILHRLESESLDYELAVTGQQFRQSPAVFNAIEEQFGHRLVQFGYVTCATRYRALQQAADIVLSTALHEFQGLAVMEAVAYGCQPIVPDRLAYPEIYPQQCCYNSCLDDPELEADSAVALILKMGQAILEGVVYEVDVSAFSLLQLAPRYEQVFRITAPVQDSQ